MIITEEKFSQELDTNIKVSRFVYTINFYVFAQINNKPGMICYDFNPVWDTFYPFYDDKNQDIIEKVSTAKTYKDLIEETDNLVKTDLQNKINLAKERFDEIVDKQTVEVKEMDNFITYEIKFSKSANIWTCYKLYNYVVTQIEDLQGLLNPKKLKSRVYDLEQSNFDKLVENAKYLLSKEDYKKYMIK